jgi:hypothetical protein
MVEAMRVQKQFSFTNSKLNIVEVSGVSSKLGDHEQPILERSQCDPRRCQPYQGSPLCRRLHPRKIRIDIGWRMFPRREGMAGSDSPLVGEPL